MKQEPISPDGSQTLDSATEVATATVKLETGEAAEPDETNKEWNAIVSLMQVDGEIRRPASLPSMPSGASDSDSSLASTVLLSPASVSLLDHADDEESVFRSESDLSGRSSRNEEPHIVPYTIAMMEEEIRQIVPIAPGWPTLAEAEQPNEDREEYTEPVMPSSRDDANYIPDVNIFISSAESESTVDGHDEV